MTDNEIIKALKEWAERGYTFCNVGMPEFSRNILSLINRQKSEIEQLKRNLEQCENGYRQQIHIMQCKYEQLQQKYDLSVTEREANVKGFTEQLANVKTEVAREIFAEIEKIIQKHYDSAQRNEEDEELEAATDYLSYVSCDLYELEEKYTGANDEDHS